MSATTAENTNNKLVTNYDTNKLLLWNNRTIEADYTNDGYDVTLEAGTVMGRVAATSKVIPLESDASDGSQYPIGVLCEETEVAEGDDAVLTLCVSGDVNENLLVFTKSGDDLDTVISGKTMRDRIGSDTVGIMLKAGQEQTTVDNQ